MVIVRFAQSLPELDRYLDQWDRLAVTAARPMMRPAWLLSWWQGRYESLAARSELRVALALDEQCLVGVLPFHVRDLGARIPQHELLGTGAFWGLGPLVHADAPSETLGLLTQALALSSPEPAVVALYAVEASEEWAVEMARLWGSRGAWIRRPASPESSLAVTLEGSFDDWLRSTRRHGGYRRTLRRLAERGVTLRRSTSQSEFRCDVRELVRLHSIRWGNVDWLELVLGNAGAQLFDDGGIRLWLLEGEEGVIGASLFSAAGGESCFLVTAYDRAWRSYGPGIATVIAGIEDAFTRGDRVVDLGYGSFEYKREMANAERPVAWYRLFPRGRVYPLAAELVKGLRVRLRARQRLAQVRNRLPTRGIRRLPRDRRP
jgi:Acetyltransferase (GNAT) domain